jgi:transposase
VLTLPPSVQIFVCTAPVDFRRGFDGLAAIVRDWLGRDPLSGHLFVFRNRRADRIKILYWDRDGFWLWYKRLERGTFRFPSADAQSLELEAADLALVLEGVDLSKVERQKRYRYVPGRRASVP